MIGGMKAGDLAVGEDAVGILAETGGDPGISQGVRSMFATDQHFFLW
jgi:hypothetical protein